MARIAYGHIFESQEEVSFILCSILVPLSPYTGDGLSKKNISSLACGSRHGILKARLVHWRLVTLCSLGIVLSTSVLGECRTQLCPSRTRCGCPSRDTLEWQSHACGGMQWSCQWPSWEEKTNPWCCQTCAFCQCKEELWASFHCVFTMLSSCFAWLWQVPGLKGTFSFGDEICL